MGNIVTVRQKVESLPDRTVALLALQQRPTATKTTCPTDAELADFIQGKLKGQAREKMLTHLDQCPDCYQHWMDELRIGSYAKPKPAIDEPVEGKQIDPWWAQLGSTLQFTWNWKVSTYFATLVIFAALINIVYHSENQSVSEPTVGSEQTSTNSLVADYEAMVKIQAIVSNTLVVPESSKMAAVPEQLNGRLSAYEMCLGNGFATLQNKETLINIGGQYKTECEFGHWIAISVVALDNIDKLTPEFWQRQLTRSQQFADYFQDSNIKRDMKAITLQYEQAASKPEKLKKYSFVDSLQSMLKMLNRSNMF